MVGRMGTSPCPGHVHTGVVALEEQHKPIPDTKACATAPPNIHPSGILPRGSGALFLGKVGNQGSEQEQQGFSFSSWILKASQLWWISLSKEKFPGNAPKQVLVQVNWAV